MVVDGRVKISVTSAQGKALVLAFFGAGTVLGLAGTILGRPYAATAETAGPTSAIFVPRQEVLHELRSDATAAWQAAQLVSENCYYLITKMATVELSESAQQKMARCLLGLIAHNVHEDGTPVKIDLSQETIAQMLGLSRETVSRQLSRFRRKGVVDWKRSDFIIRNRRALKQLAALPPEIPGAAEEDSGSVTTQ